MTPTSADAGTPAVVRAEVVFGWAPRQVDVTAVQLPAGATAGQAVDASGVLQRHPQFGAQPVSIGIWGHACDRDTPLRDGDRVELYRPLLVDPKDARRSRSRRQAGVSGKPGR